MKRLMVTFQSDYSKLNTVSNSKSMISHYCNSESSLTDKNTNSIDEIDINLTPEKASPVQTDSFYSAGKYSLMDQLTSASERVIIFYIKL